MSAYVDVPVLFVSALLPDQPLPEAVQELAVMLAEVQVRVVDAP